VREANDQLDSELKFLTLNQEIFAQRKNIFIWNKNHFESQPPK